MTRTMQPSGKGPTPMSDVDKSTFESMILALVVLDDSLNIIRSNRRFRELFKLAEQPGPETHLREVLPNRQLERTVSRAVTSGEVAREIEFSCEFADVGERHFLVAISKMQRPAPGGHILLTFNDITEWRRRQTQVAQAHRLLSIGEMVAGIAHEVNNPLAAVMGFSQLALRRSSDRVVRGQLEKILEQAQRAANVINDLQSFAGRNSPNMLPVNLLQLVEAVLATRSSELKAKNVLVLTRFEPGPKIVLGEAYQIEQVFLNMIANAEESMVDANRGGTLTIAVACTDGMVCVSFTDDGPGIRACDRSKVFDPFFTTKEVGRGSGLGLSVCFGIIQDHGGTIDIEASSGDGATFSVRLPVFLDS